MSETEKGTVLGHCGLTEGEVGLVSTAFISGGNKVYLYANKEEIWL